VDSGCTRGVFLKYDLGYKSLGCILGLGYSFGCILGLGYSFGCILRNTSLGYDSLGYDSLEWT
jgi:hypothetical protein